MNSYSGRRTTWDVQNEEDSETPPFQRWLRYLWNSTLTDAAYAKESAQNFLQSFARQPKVMTEVSVLWIVQQVCSVTGGLVILWLLFLHHGEVSVFEQSISKCHWSSWEQWPQHASPHRLVFVADPQLVDPHTYPGRPPPLSTVTVQQSDLYMRRSYSRIQQDLLPDTIMFLGDLFDGGREWSTKSTQSLDERWNGYGDPYWRHEYKRFSDIFLRDWRQTFEKDAQHDRDNPHTRIIASLPGNHDLGFGEMIQLPVRERFNAFFGDSNRVDLIGNHTVVSVDTVSLSAMDDERSDPAIWHPAYDFLKNVKATRASVVHKHFGQDDQDSRDENKFAHLVEDLEDRVPEVTAKASSKSDSPHMPTILLTHVPLDRPPGKPCGPLRERWPPTPPPEGQMKPVDPDERNALRSLGSGWQYKNALSTRVSRFIIESLDGSIDNAFSGDDHDFCEVTHDSYARSGKGIKEITVKSLSWTMGVRKPGFLLVSLWNELDTQGRPVNDEVRRNVETLQTHLCLLPDQIHTFIMYGGLLGASLVLLAFQATYKLYLLQNNQPGLRDETAVPLLPISGQQASSAEREKLHDASDRSSHLHAPSQASSSSSDEGSAANVSARSPANTRPRSISPLPSYGFNAQLVPSPPLVSYATNRLRLDGVAPRKDAKWLGSDARLVQKARISKPRPILVAFGLMFAREVWIVARIVLVWYFWLLYQ